MGRVRKNQYNFVNCRGKELTRPKKCDFFSVLSGETDGVCFFAMPKASKAFPYTGKTYVQKLTKMSETKQVKKKAFKMRAMHSILTYKDVGLSKEEILERCSTVPHLFGAAVAAEKYKKGDNHFHVFLATTKPPSLGMTELDTIGGVHGNYMPVKITPKKALAYVIKDGNYCATETEPFETYIQSALASYAYRSAGDVFFAAFTAPNGRLPPRNFQLQTKTGTVNK